MSITIRKPKKEEYQRIADILNSSYSLYRSVYAERYLKMIKMGEETIESLWQEPGKETRDYRVALKNNKVVGFLSWYIKLNRVAWVSMLYVDRKHHKEGTGELLLDWVEKRARKEGAMAVALEMQKRAHWAEAFYKKHNYLILSKKELSTPPFKNTLLKDPVRYTHIFGKEL